MPKSARWPEVTIDIGVGQMRAFEFDALAGDGAIHCHKSHHTMSAMGHSVPAMIGVDHRDVAKKISKLVPDYMGTKATEGTAHEEIECTGLRRFRARHGHGVGSWR